MMKICKCVDCYSEIEVHKNSPAKRCKSCILVRRKIYSRNYMKTKGRSSRDNELKKLSERRKLNHSYRLLCNARKRSREIGVDFNLTESDIVIPERCPILNTEFDYKTYYTHSIDRIDNSKGYIKGNVQVISHLANAMKNSASKEELLSFAKWINENYLEEE